LKELVNEVRVTRAKAYDDLGETIKQSNNLMKSVNSLCTSTQDVDSGGSKLLGSLTKAVDKTNKGLLKATLISTITKATELFNSCKSAKDQLDNAKKAFENYKTITQ
jgi:ABC-type transporter Mla subunit MlaD